jgi:hypothetical protein
VIAIQIIPPGCIRTFIILSSDGNSIILGCIVHGDEYIDHTRKAMKEISKKGKEISEERRA